MPVIYKDDGGVRRSGSGEEKGVFMTLLCDQFRVCLDLPNSQRGTLWKQAPPKYMEQEMQL